jgi:hypothetical protein
MVRFEVPIQPKDGSAHCSLYKDLDLPLVPHRDDSVLLYDSVTTSVLQVTFAPSMDPAVFVRCRALFPLDAKEAKEIVNDAQRKEGWTKIG